MNRTENARSKGTWPWTGGSAPCAGRRLLGLAWLGMLGGSLVLGPGGAVRCGAADATGTRIRPAPEVEAYPDGRPAARFRLEAKDAGAVFRHGSGPGRCDELGARDVWVWEADGVYHMHYDGAGPRGWLACLAVSRDLVRWEARGPVIGFGEPGSPDSASASYGVTFRHGGVWHLFYLGTPNATPAPDFVPAFPYLTLKARGASPTGPWVKQASVRPFETKPGTYYSVTASPGQVVRDGAEFLMFFSAASDGPIRRTLGLARTRDLDGAWTLDPAPLLPPEEQIENTTLHHDAATGLWFLFTNHVGLRDGLEYTDAIWVYWSRDLRRWDSRHKAVVLDRRNCAWSPHIIGLPSVVRVGERLALFYDGHAGREMPFGVKSHMRRDVGLAWIDLPIRIPESVVR